MRLILIVLATAALPWRAGTQALANVSVSTAAVPAATPSPSVDPCATTLALVSRPSVTTSACAVPPGRVLIEAGYQNTTADGGAPLVQYPQALLRVGTRLQGLEIAVGPPAFERAASANGTSDTTFGAKYELGHTDKFVYSVNAFVSVPTGQNGYSANGTGYVANLNLSYTLTPGLGLAGTFGYNRLAQSAERFTSVIPSLVLSGALSPSSSLFGEVATFSRALGAGTATRTQYLVGVQQSFANRLQLDIEAGRSPTVATGKYRYIGAGISYYF